jgi:hypothetical protein
MGLARRVRMKGSMAERRMRLLLRMKMMRMEMKTEGLGPWRG